MNIIAIIPARGGSKGIPNKNLLKVNGKPLLWYTLHRAKQSKYLNNIYVSSDSKKIGHYALDNGASWVLRPKKISGDTAASEDAIHHTINKLPKKPDLIVFLQNTSPLRDRLDIDKCIEHLLENDLDSVFSGAVAPDFFLWAKKNGVLHGLNHDYRQRERRQDRGDQYIENGSIYVFRTDLFLNKANRIGGKKDVYLMKPWTVHELDSLDDLESIEFYLKKKWKD